MLRAFNMADNNYFKLSIQVITLLLLTRGSIAQSQSAIYLTPLIEAGEIDTARKLSELKPLVPDLTSFAGYLTTDASCGSNIFFWFFPAETDWQTAPVTIWLQGGPGMPVMYGILYENGPIQITEDDKLQLREHRWTKTSSMLYIDSPLGSGWSYTTKDECYSTTDPQIAAHLLSALRQFYTLFPELLPNPFYIFSEGNGSKFNLHLASLIHDENQKGGQVINMQGIGMGNPYIHSMSQGKYADHFFNMGFIDDNQKLEFQKLEQILENEIRLNNRSGSYVIMRDMLLSPNSLFSQYSGHHNFYNFKFVDIPLASVNNIQDVIKHTEIDKAAHMEDAFMNPRTLSLSFLENEMVYSVIHLLEKLVEHYKVLVFDGQFNVLFPPYHTMEWMKVMKWAGAEEYKMTKRHFWYVDNNLAGYWKKVGKFTHVLVRDAGHLVPTDQHEWTYDMFHRFINEIPFVNKKVYKPNDW